MDRYCPWELHPDQGQLHVEFPNAPEGSVLVRRFCPAGFPGPDNYPLDEDFYIPGYVDPVVTPAAVGEDIWVEVRGQVLAPEVAADPAIGTAAVVDVPTFLEVTNWQGELHEEECMQGDLSFICIEVTATPSLSFEPGDGGGTVRCEEPGSTESGSRFGTRFDGAGDPQAQADVAGACAYAYPRDSADQGTWTGQVVVTWQASWSSEYFGTGGDFAPHEETTDLVRQVDEIQSIVTDGRLTDD